MVVTPFLTAFDTLLRKEIRRFIRIWPQTVLPPTVTTALYFIIFGHLIGSQIAPIGGYPFIDFIVPGLIIMAVINNAYANVVASFFSAKMQRFIEELLVSPIPNWLIVLGYVAGGVARGVTVGAAVAVVASLFTTLQWQHPLLLLTVVFLSAIAASLGGLINAIHARTYDDISIIPTFVLTPLTYLGGVFYSIELLSPLWQQLSLFNPILYIVNLFRHSMLGVSDVNLFVAFGMILLSILLLAAYAIHCLNHGRGIRG